MEKKELFNWFSKKEKTFTIAEVEQLLEEVKVFNAGAIDDYLTKHVDNVFKKWLENKKGQ